MKCQTPEELLAATKEEGYELTASELALISGGAVWGGTKRECPKCHSTNVTDYQPDPHSMQLICECQNCGHKW